MRRSHLPHQTRPNREAPASSVADGDGVEGGDAPGPDVG